MTGFSADWLSLRERYDDASRARGLEDRLEAALGERTRISVVDMGCGTGSNLRHLAPRLRYDQDWRLVDYDDALLSAAREALTTWARQQGHGLSEDADGRLLIARGDHELTVSFERRDLSKALPDFTGCDLVTASALLDLVSQAWVDDLARALKASGAMALFVLTYDGRARWQPTAEADARITDSFNRHQRTDKGFGPALGPDAALRSLAAFSAAGLSVEEAESDWHFTPEDAAIQQALLAGWAAAAQELAPEDGPMVEAWLEQRCDFIVSGLSSCLIGHKDLLVLPKAGS